MAVLKNMSIQPQPTPCIC